jgi:potassium uptake TrkH family protein
MEEHYSWANIYIKWINRIMPIITILAIISLIIEHGFYIKSSLYLIINRFNLVIIQFYFIQYIFKLATCKNKLTFLKAHWFETLLAFLILVETSWVLSVFGLGFLKKYFISNIDIVTRVYIILAQFLIILTFIPDVMKYNQNLSKLKFHPAFIILLSFMIVIIVGSLLLMLPKAVRFPYKISFIDALFTSTSATCVTGLIVLDTPKMFSPFGQIIILSLIQIGGIGIITISSFFMMFFGKGIGIKERVFLRDVISIENFDTLLEVLKNIIITVFFIEIIGAFLLALSWLNQGWSFHKLLFNSIFHSVSAFCNAGFSTFSDSFIQFKANVSIILIISALIILGGLGFVTIMDIVGYKILSKVKIKKPHFKVQTKLVLIVTIILIFVGFISFLLIEPISKQLDIKTKLLTAFFTSVTSRTAGFNTIDMGLLSTPMSLFLIVLMFIGASPGSTGGGIKTVTVAVLWISIASILTGKKRVEVFKKNIPFVILNRSIIIFFFSIIFISCITLILTITEKSPLLDIMFEVVSAFGTVGLSRGLTPNLSLVGKIIIIIAMFIGRIGILTLAFAIANPKDQSTRIEYPAEDVMVG